MAIYIKAVPYIRSSTKAYDGFWGKNGYNCIECGYIIADSDGAIQDKVVISHIETHDCDVIHYYPEPDTGEPINLHIDCLGDGYLRIFDPDFEHPVRWDADESGKLTAMKIVEGEPDFEYWKRIEEKRKEQR